LVLLCHHTEIWAIGKLPIIDISNAYIAIAKEGMTSLEIGDPGKHFIFGILNNFLLFLMRWGEI
jgi:hypothetical protein